jgi:hypothetical protein
MQRGLFRDSPGRGGPSHGDSSFPHPNDPGGDDQQ